MFPGPAYWNSHCKRYHALRDLDQELAGEEQGEDVLGALAQLCPGGLRVGVVVPRPVTLSDGRQETRSQTAPGRQKVSEIVVVPL